MENNIQAVETETTQEIQVETKEAKPEVQVSKPESNDKNKRNEILRELSKEMGLNLFEEDGLDKLRDKLSKDKESKEELNKKIQEYATKEDQFRSKEELLHKHVQALSLGFKLEDIEEVLALAAVYTKEGVTFEESLNKVKTKWYGNRNQSLELGLSFSDVQNQEVLSDKDRYIQNSPLLKKIYGKKD